MNLSARIDDSEIRYLSKLYPKKAPMMINRAINKTGRFARTRVDERLRERHINLKKKDLKRNLLLKTGNRARPFAVLTITGSRIPLIYFGGKDLKATTKKKTGVQYKIRPFGGKKTVKDGFVRPVRSRGGKPGIFVRKTKQRKPIRELLGPSVPHVMEEDRVTLNLRPQIQEKLTKEAASQVQLLLSKRR